MNHDKVEVTLNFDDATKDFLDRVVRLSKESLDTVVGVLLAAHIERTEGRTVSRKVNKE